MKTKKSELRFTAIVIWIIGIFIILLLYAVGLLNDNTLANVFFSWSALFILVELAILLLGG